MNLLINILIGLAVYYVGIIFIGLPMARLSLRKLREANIDFVTFLLFPVTVVISERDILNRSSGISLATAMAGGDSSYYLQLSAVSWPLRVVWNTFNVACHAAYVTAKFASKNIYAIIIVPAVRILMKPIKILAQQD